MTPRVPSVLPSSMTSIDPAASTLGQTLTVKMRVRNVGDEAQIFQWTNVILGVGDPEYVQSYEDLMAAFMTLHQMAMELGQQRLVENIVQRDCIGARHLLVQLGDESLQRKIVVRIHESRARRCGLRGNRKRRGSEGSWPCLRK